MGRHSHEYRWATPPEPWEANAACANQGSDLFFDLGRTAEAVAICNTCPVLAECRTWAVAAGPTLHGTWGGTSWWDRQKLRRAERESGAG